LLCESPTLWRRHGRRLKVRPGDNPNQRHKFRGLSQPKPANRSGRLKAALGVSIEIEEVIRRQHGQLGRTVCRDHDVVIVALG
jgi:hypothetical protein